MNRGHHPALGKAGSLPTQINVASLSAILVAKSERVQQVEPNKVSLDKQGAASLMRFPPVDAIVRVNLFRANQGFFLLRASVT